MLHRIHIGTALALLLAATAATQELPVSEPRPFIAAGRRLDGAWNDPRVTNAILASRVMRGRDPLDTYGIGLRIPDGHYFDQVVVATAGDTALAVLHVFGTTELIGAARITKDGAPIDRDVRAIGYGREPAAASNGETFAVAYAISSQEVEIKLLSPRLDVVDQARFTGSHPRVVASGGRYLVAFTDGTRLRAVTVVNGEIGRNPFDVAQVSPWHPSALLTANGSPSTSWTAALVNDAIEVCDISPSGASCRKAIRLDAESYVSDIAPAGEALLIAWYSETGRVPGHPPQSIYKPHLTRVTADGAEELSMDPVAAPSDDDILMLPNGGEALRVGRKGAVALIPFSLALPQQDLAALLPAGDGATAFWTEIVPTLDTWELHATRFTASGIDAGVHDRLLGRALPLGSDGRNVLLSDGRLIAPAGDVAGTLAVPKDAGLAGWDGSQWVFVTNDSIVRGAETIRISWRNAIDLACIDGACLFVWITEGGSTTGASAMYIATGRPLKRARAHVLARDIRSYQTIGAAAAGESLLAFWANEHVRNVQGRAFDANGRMSKPFLVASAVGDGDPLFFEAGGGPEALVVQNGWPRQRLVRLRPDGSVIATHPLENVICRGAARVGGKTLLYVERKAAMFPYVPAKRAFVVFAP